MASDLPRFQAGQAFSEVSARQMNSLVEEVRRLKGLISTGGLNIPSGAKTRTTERGELPPFTVRRFVVENANDYPDTFSVSDFKDGPSVGHVARPYLLRRTPFHGKSRDGIDYSYTSNVKRTASKTVPGSPPTTTTEAQVIVPKYVKNDVLYAVRHIFGPLDEYPVAQGNADKVQTDWVDLNVDGRYWAKQSA
jgi:hypothetical protein